MNDVSVPAALTQREVLIHALYEAAELEHNLMCTYLYAAVSLKDGEAEGLSAEEAAAVKRWRQVLLGVAIEEMGHLAAVWNITSALGGSPRFGRTNFPLDPGYLPACVVVKLAPFTADTLQHFVFLERPHGSTEQDGGGFAYERPYVRGGGAARLTPMAVDYSTVGDFYAALGEGLRALVARYGESNAFDGDPALQLSPEEVSLAGAKQVRCLKTALAAFAAIVEQGEGAPRDTVGSHYQKFLGIRTELRALMAKNPDLAPAHPAATNPVLRRPPRPEGRVWLENPDAVAAVDLANACYGLMLRLLAYAYAVRGPSAEKSLAVDLAIGLMQAVMPLAERAARLPAGPSNPQCNAGLSFIALRDSAALPPGPAARRLFVERFEQLAEGAAALRASGDARAVAAADQVAALASRASRGFDLTAAAAAAPEAAASGAAPPSSMSAGVETVQGRQIELQFEAKRCIHSRFCVTWAPKVFLANVQGPWIHPDGVPDEPVPAVNLASVREAGPYAFRAVLQIDGVPAGFRATLCRCGASKNKPYCDGSHLGIGFKATGEPPSGKTDMLPVRDGVLAIDPQVNGPLRVRGNLEITSGTGRVVARVTSTYLCRCGGSANKPFCDGTHTKIGFRSD